jgi:phospholipase/carboxylesterase
MGTSLGYSWFLNDQDGNLLAASKQLAEQYVLDLIAQVGRDYSISEVYLLGFSQGGALAYITGIGHPAAIEGIVCFDSPFDLSWFDQPELFKEATGLRVFIAHATDDPAVEYQKGVEAAEQLEQQGFDVRFLQFEGGHTLTAAALKEVETWIENPPED